MIARIASPFTGGALRARALRGTMITFLAFGGSNIVRLASNLILTRLLFPEAFGLMALVQVVLTGLVMFSDTGIGMSILQNPRGTEPAFLRTAWTVQIGRGILLWIAVLVLAWPVSTFYEQPILAWMLPAAGLTAIVQGLNSTKLFTANRNLMLGRLTAIDLGTQIAGTVLMVVFAWLSGSVWALVWGSVLGAAIKTVLSHVAMPGRSDRLGWDRGVFDELFHFGKWIFLGSIAGFLVNSADRGILGKFVAIDVLGIYNIGYFLATVPLMLTRQLEGRILIPIFARIADAPPAEARANIRRTRLPLTGALIGLSLAAAILGEWVVDLLYDSQYALAGPILVLLALSYLPTIIVNPYASIMIAHGKSRDFTLYVCALSAIQTALLFYGVSRYGLIGALVAPGLSMMLVYPLAAWLAARRGGWDPALDAGFFALSAAGAALALWINGDAVTAVLAGG